MTAPSRCRILSFVSSSGVVLRRLGCSWSLEKLFLQKKSNRTFFLLMIWFTPTHLQNQQTPTKNHSRKGDNTKKRYEHTHAHQYKIIYVIQEHQSPHIYSLPLFWPSLLESLSTAPLAPAALGRLPTPSSAASAAPSSAELEAEPDAPGAARSPWWRGPSSKRPPRREVERFCAERSCFFWFLFRFFMFFPHGFRVSCFGWGGGHGSCFFCLFVGFGWGFGGWRELGMMLYVFF